jgi:hypothetical protein
MRRSEVYKLIDGERDYQDAKWGILDERPLSVGDWLLILELELNEAKQAWCKNTKGKHSVYNELRQIATVAVAALEQYGCASRGLQP